jgi:hypothetical protein
MEKYASTSSLRKTTIVHKVRRLRSRSRSQVTTAYITAATLTNLDTKYIRLKERSKTNVSNYIRRFYLQILRSNYRRFGFGKCSFYALIFFGQKNMDIFHIIFFAVKFVGIEISITALTDAAQSF